MSLLTRYSNHIPKHNALVCLSGHVVDDALDEHPDQRKNFCERCGQKTFSQCEKCKKPIEGYNHQSQFPMKLAAYCNSCGSPFPWTQQKIDGAKELADELDGLNAQEKADLKKSLDEMAKDSPKAQAASVRFKKLVAKGGKFAVGQFKELLSDIVSKAMKEFIWSGK